MNHIKQVLKILGLKNNENFKIEGKEELFRINENHGLEIQKGGSEGHWFIGEAHFDRILLGKDKIIKLPFSPEQDEEYSLSKHEPRICSIMKILDLHDKEIFIVNENEDYIYTVHKASSFIEIQENFYKYERKYAPLEDFLLRIISLGLRVEKLGESHNDQKDQIAIRIERLMKFFELEENVVFRSKGDYLFICDQIVYRIHPREGKPRKYACVYSFLADRFIEDDKIISTHHHI